MESEPDEGSIVGFGVGSRVVGLWVVESFKVGGFVVGD